MSSGGGPSKLHAILDHSERRLCTLSPHSLTYDDAPWSVVLSKCIINLPLPTVPTVRKFRSQVSLR